MGCMFKAQISKKLSWLFQQGCAKHGSGNGKVCALMSVFRYSIYTAMLIIISKMLSLTQQTTWEVPSSVMDSMCDLGYKLRLLTIVEIVLFVVDFRTFVFYPVFWKIIYIVPILASLGFIYINVYGNIGALFQYREELLSTANIWGSIIGLIWSGLLMMMRSSNFTLEFYVDK